MAIDEKALKEAQNAYENDEYAESGRLRAAIKAYESAKEPVSSDSVNIPMRYADGKLSQVQYDKPQGGGFFINVREFIHD